MRCEHVSVYDVEGDFAGWPANHGIWSFGDEIVVGFNLGKMKTKDFDHHKIDGSKPSYRRQSRSLDGGRTWALEEIPNVASFDYKSARPFDGELNFLDRETSLRFAPSGLDAGAVSPFFYSTDRCKTWIGPFETPSMGLSGISARTELLPLSQSEALLFFACPKSDGYEGRAAVAKISQGGKKFKFLSYIGGEPEGFTIMPASFKRENGEIIAILREEGRVEGLEKIARLSQYVSPDLGKTWVFDQYIDHLDHSTPPALVQSADGRLFLSYGFRDKPEGVAARVSEDEGRTWSDRRMLRSDGAYFPDIGYARIVALPGGGVFTAYYYNTHENGNRKILGTIFDL